MKIAVCISGFLRIFKETYNNHNVHLFSPLKEIGDVDVFVHTWDSIDCNSDVSSFVSSIGSIWNPLECVIEPYFEFDISKYSRHYGRCNNVISMFYKIKKCFELAKRSGEYDVFVRLRSDHLFLNGPSRDEVLRAKHSGEIIFPSTNINTEVNDQFCLTNLSGLESYSSVFDNIDKYYDQGLEINPELIFNHHLKALSQKTFISNVAFCDYTFNSTFTSWDDYSSKMKLRHPDIVI